MKAIEPALSDKMEAGPISKSNELKLRRRGLIRACDPRDSAQANSMSRHCTSSSIATCQTTPAHSALCPRRATFANHNWYRRSSRFPRRLSGGRSRRASFHSRSSSVPELPPGGSKKSVPSSSALGASDGESATQNPPPPTAPHIQRPRGREGNRRDTRNRTQMAEERP